MNSKLISLVSRSGEIKKIKKTKKKITNDKIKNEILLCSTSSRKEILLAHGDTD